MQLHPDSNEYRKKMTQRDKEKDLEKFLRIQQAYDIILDVIK